MDEDLDELRETLLASEGITAILHEDREMFHLRVDGLGVSAIEEKVHEAIAKPVWTARGGETSVGTPAQERLAFPLA